MIVSAGVFPRISGHVPVNFASHAAARHAERKKGYVKRGFKKNGAGGKFTYGSLGCELTDGPDLPSACAVCDCSMELRRGRVSPDSCCVCVGPFRVTDDPTREPEDSVEITEVCLREGCGAALGNVDSLLRAGRCGC